MTVEVTYADVEAVEAKVSMEFVHWNLIEPKEIIAAAWEVLRKRHADTLADAVLEATKQDCVPKFVKSAGGQVVVTVSAFIYQARRIVPADDNFATLATAAVRQLSQQVRQ